MLKPPVIRAEQQTSQKRTVYSHKIKDGRILQNSIVKIKSVFELEKKIHEATYL